MNKKALKDIEVKGKKSIYAVLTLMCLCKNGTLQMINVLRQHLPTINI